VFFLEKEIPETRSVAETRENSELRQLRQQLQHANETIVKLQQQLKPTHQTRSLLFMMYDNELSD